MMKMPGGGGVMNLLSKVSGRVLQEMAAGEEDVLANLSGARHARSVCPVSDDARLIVTGFLGEDAGVKIPNSAKALQRCSLGDLRARVASKHGPTAAIAIWNLSGERYEYEDLEVTEHNFGVHPAPPLATLRCLVREITGWLQDGPHNVAVIHDLSGRRSAVVAACCLLALEADLTQAGALAKIGNALGAPGQALVPSQLRYIDYFAQQARSAGVDALPPSPQRLERIIVNGIPDYVNESGSGPQAPVRCRPFAKVILGTQVVAGAQPGAVYTPDDLCFSLVPLAPFPGATKKAKSSAGVVVDGDVLVRVYHAQEDTQRATPMFALAFHTAFVRDGVLRASAEEIDGAKGNGRFPSSFFVDLIFTPQRTDGSAAAVLETSSFENAAGRANRGNGRRAHIIGDDDDDKNEGDDGKMAAGPRASGREDSSLVKELRKYNTTELTTSTDEQTSDAADAPVDDVEKLMDELDLELSDADGEQTDAKKGLDLDAIGDGEGPNESDEDDLDDFDVDAFASSLDLDFDADGNEEGKMPGDAAAALHS